MNVKDILPLAIGRYPRTPSLLAVMFFTSDRRAAGLGALDQRKRDAERTGRRPVDAALAGCRTARRLPARRRSSSALKIDRKSVV